MTTALTDQELVRRSQAGDAEAFGALYDRYVRKIHDFIYYKVHHRETAQDLCADVFLKALRAVGRLDPERGSVQAWLYRIARNSVIDHYRSRRETAELEDAWGLGAGDRTESDLDALLKIEKVRAAMVRLTPEQREIITLRVWQELSHQEISEIIGKSEAACKMSFSRAVKDLRDHLPLTLLILMLIPTLWKK